jgi:hypothetical protein
MLRRYAQDWRNTKMQRFKLGAVGAVCGLALLLPVSTYVRHGCLVLGDGDYR